MADPHQPNAPRPSLSQSMSWRSTRQISSQQGCTWIRESA